MLFNSNSFVLFFSIVTVAYFILPQRLRWLLLLVTSCYFYIAFIPIYILILFFTILVDYIAGILIENSQELHRKQWLVLSLVANIGILFVFKYADFAVDNAERLVHLLGFNYSFPIISIVLPIGLSFHTFQSMSYTIEVYRGRQKAERHLGLFALYVMFYPQLVAGPIERPQNMLHQFNEYHAFDYQRVTDGLKRMAWGFFKKIVIADQLAVIVNRVYDQPTSFSGLILFCATICFSYQIYCDFSGYSDIAIGAAQVMGIKLMDNFKQPYWAQSISEFWSRWHISLSTWFRDYLYIPLGGNRVVKWRWKLNILIVFIVSGLWHGANWTYVVWGALHGLYLIAENWLTVLWGRYNLSRLLRGVLNPGMTAIGRRIIVFLLVSFAWTFFRAESLSEGLYIATHIMSGMGHFLTSITDPVVVEQIDKTGLSNMIYILPAIIMLEVVQWYQQRGSLSAWFSQKHVALRWAAYYALVAWIVAYWGAGSQQFIYFQF